MNTSRIVLAGLGGTVAYFVVGFLSFALVPQLGDEFRKYPAIYRTQQGIVLIGIFAVCAFVLHNYVNLKIGLTLTLQQAAAYFIEWTVVGLLIGVIYKPK
jgi:hypothetical protein